MLERHQLQDIVDRVLEQAGAGERREVESAILIHGEAGWSHHPLRDGFRRIAETGAIHAADAYVCVVARPDIAILAAELGLTAPATEGQDVVVLAQSLAGDVVGGEGPELAAMRERLAEILLAGS
jgi:hypothetical protein